METEEKSIRRCCLLFWRLISHSRYTVYRWKKSLQSKKKTLKAISNWNPIGFKLKMYSQLPTFRRMATTLLCRHSVCRRNLRTNRLTTQRYQSLFSWKFYDPTVTREEIVHNNAPFLIWRYLLRRHNKLDFRQEIRRNLCSLQVISQLRASWLLEATWVHFTSEQALRRLVIFNHCLNLEALGRTVFTALDEDFLQRDWSWVVTCVRRTVGICALVSHFQLWHVLMIGKFIENEVIDVRKLLCEMSAADFATRRS